MVHFATLLTVGFAGLVAAAPTTSSLEPRNLKGSGKLTWYTEGLATAATACGTMHALTEHIAALSPEDYGTYANPNNSPVCKKHIKIHGPNGNTITAKVVDRCAGCTTGHVDVTPTVFESLGYATSLGVVEGITWELV